MPMDLVVRVSTSGNEYTLNAPGPHRVGRGEDASIRVMDRRVSRAHGELECRGGEWVYRDCSTSGTYVAGERTEMVSLMDGVTLRLADPAEGPELTCTPCTEPAWYSESSPLEVAVPVNVPPPAEMTAPLPPAFPPPLDPSFVQPFGSSAAAAPAAR